MAAFLIVFASTILAGNWCIIKKMRQP